MRLTKVGHKGSLNELNFREVSPMLAKGVRRALLLEKSFWSGMARCWGDLARRRRNGLSFGGTGSCQDECNAEVSPLQK